MKTSHLKKRRKKRSEQRRATSSSEATPSDNTSEEQAVPIVDLPAPDPPKKNLTLLVSVVALFVLWLGFLIWLCFAG